MLSKDSVKHISNLAKYIYLSKRKIKKSEI